MFYAYSTSSHLPNFAYDINDNGGVNLDDQFFIFWYVFRYFLMGKNENDKAACISYLTWLFININNLVKRFLLIKNLEFLTTST